MKIILSKPLLGIATSFVLLGACSRQDIDSQHQNLQSVPTSEVTKEQAENETVLANPEEIGRRWLELLKVGKYAELQYRCQRTTSRRPFDGSESDGVVTADVVVEAQVVMYPDGLWLVASDNDPKQNRTTGKPSLVLSFSNGKIREKVWYPKLKEYREKEYDSPSPWGADSTDYENACQLGTLLRTWLGDHAPVRAMFEAGFAMAEMPPKICMVNGVQCFEFSFDSDPQADPMKGQEKYVGSYFFDRAGMLKRDVQTMRVAKSGYVFEIVNTQDYDFRILLVPPESTGQGLDQNSPSK